MTPLRRDRGQAAVLTVMFMVVLLGMAAAVLDVGHWYRDDRRLQATMDAAALAGGQALPDDPGQANALAGSYAGKNGGGLDKVEITMTKIANDTIKVTGSRPSEGFFSRLFGIDSVTVNATAKARTGILASARWAAPIAVDRKHPLLQCNPAPCSQAATELALEKVGPGAFRLINIDQSHGGTGPQILADWIQRGYEGYMPLNWYFSDSGAKFNSSQVKGALDAVIGKELLFPVYDDTRGGGANFEYEVVGWVGFVITSYEIQGSKKNKLYGHFTRVIWEGIYSESETSPDFGARAVSLVE
jgi:putative Flp pilus-assembly TadE/G-like protein